MPEFSKKMLTTMPHYNKKRSKRKRESSDDDELLMPRKLLCPSNKGSIDSTIQESLNSIPKDVTQNKNIEMKLCNLSPKDEKADTVKIENEITLPEHINSFPELGGSFMETEQSIASIDNDSSISQHVLISTIATAEVKNIILADHSHMDCHTSDACSNVEVGDLLQSNPCHAKTSINENSEIIEDAKDTITLEGDIHESSTGDILNKVEPKIFFPFVLHEFNSSYESSIATDYLNSIRLTDEILDIDPRLRRFSEMSNLHKHPLHVDSSRSNQEIKSSNTLSKPNVSNDTFNKTKQTSSLTTTDDSDQPVCVGVSSKPCVNQHHTSQDTELIKQISEQVTKNKDNTIHDNSVIRESMTDMSKIEISVSETDAVISTEWQKIWTDEKIPVPNLVNIKDPLQLMEPDFWFSSSSLSPITTEYCAEQSYPERVIFMNSSPIIIPQSPTELSRSNKMADLKENYDSIGKNSRHKYGCTCTCFTDSKPKPTGDECKIYIGDIPPFYTFSELLTRFRQFGYTVKVDFHRSRAIADRPSSMHHCFITYDDVHSVQRAIKYGNWKRHPKLIICCANAYKDGIIDGYSLENIKDCGYGSNSDYGT